MTIHPLKAPSRNLEVRINDDLIDSGPLWNVARGPEEAVALKKPARRSRGPEEAVALKKPWP